jgi:O-antigen/teichoic acid export membrane protein
MARSATAIIPRVLGFIPLAVSLLCLILLLIYRPPYYVAVVSALCFSYVVMILVFVIVLKKARKLRKEKELVRSQKPHAVGAEH